MGGRGGGGREKAVSATACGCLHQLTVRLTERCRSGEAKEAGGDLCRGRWLQGRARRSRRCAPPPPDPDPKARPHHTSPPSSLSFSLSLSLSRELFKLAVLLPLVPLRIAAALSACVVLAALSWTAAAGWNMEEPLPRHRRALAVAGSKLAGVVLFCLGFSVRVEGKANIRAGKAARAVAVFNHVRRGGGGGGETLRGG